MSTMNIPDDVWTYILGFCENTAARSVCKRWKRLAPHVCLGPDGFVDTVDVARWAIKAGCTPNYLCKSAAAVGRITVIQWISTWHPWNTRVVSAMAAGHGHLEIVKWINERELGWERRWNCFVAAAGNHVDVLAYSYYSVMPDVIADVAAYNGCFEVLKWLKEVKSPSGWQYTRRSIKRVHLVINKKTCYAAALGGHLDILIWLGDMGFHIHKQLAIYALMYDRLDILQMMRSALTIPLNIYDLAVMYGNPEAVQWAEQNKFTSTPEHPVKKRRCLEEITSEINITWLCVSPIKAVYDQGKIAFRYDRDDSH